MTAYKVEELLALRDSASESAVSFIEKFGDEQAIKEHVLRPSASAGVIGSQLLGNRVRASAGAVNGKKPSPSPSFKRNKVENLIREHGSPPGMRVTAGGRVVPIDLPPLSSPRFPFGNGKAQATNRATSAPQLFPANNINAHSVFPVGGSANPPFIVVDGQLYQMFNNQYFPVPVFNVPQPHLAATPGLHMGDQFVPQLSAGFLAPGVRPSVGLSPLAAQIPMQSGIPPLPSAAPSQQVAADPNIDLATKTKMLQQEYSKLEGQLKELERLEVVQADEMGPQWRQEVVKTKRAFITVLDVIRKMLKAMRGESSDCLSAISSKLQPLPVSTSSSTAQLTATHLQFTDLNNKSVGSLPISQSSPIDASYYQSLGYRPQLDIEMPVQTLDASTGALNGGGNFSGNTPQPATSNGTISPPWRSNGPRRSHAVEIKDPREGSKKPPGQQSKSALNPTSPTYEPTSRVKTPEPRSPGIFVPPSPSPIPSPTRHEAVEAQHPWLFDQPYNGENGEVPKSASAKTVRHKSSATSVQTADFFPVNTHEHSTKNTNGAKSKSGSPLKMGHPEEALVTPEKKFLMNMNLIESRFRSPNDENTHPAAPPVSPADTRGSSHNDDHNKSFDGYTLSSTDTLRQTIMTAGHNHTVETPRTNCTSSASGPAHSEDGSTLQNPQMAKYNSPAFLEGYNAGRNLQQPHEGDHDYIAGYSQGLADRLKSQTIHTGGPACPGKFTEVFHSNSNSLASRSSANALALEIGSNAIPIPTRRAHAPERPHYPPGLPRPSVDVPFVTRPGASIWSPTKNEGFHKDFQPRRPVPAVYTTPTTKGSENAGFDQRMASSSPMTNPSRSTQPAFTPLDSRGLGMFPSSLPAKISTSTSGQRYYPLMKVPGQQEYHRSPRKGDPGRISQNDGALDDMAELVEGVGPSSPPSSKTAGTKPSGSSPRKGDSPAKAKLEQLASSVAKQVRGSRSKKAVEDEQKSADDPSHMNQADRRRWRENWRKRFSDLKNKEREEIDQCQDKNTVDE